MAGGTAIAFIVFGWPLWPLGWTLILLFLLADFALES